MHSKKIALAVILGFTSFATFAEPAVQPGETLESLAKVRVNTTVNGQPGSIKQLVAAGQIKVAAEDLPVSVDDIDSIIVEETAAPKANSKVETSATEKKAVQQPAQAAAETAPAAPAEEMVNVEDIDPAQPA